VVCPISVQERLRGWRCGSFFHGRRPYADSRVRLTGGRKAHNSRRGGVLSSRTPTTSGMVLQRLGWRRAGGDGCTGPMVMEETCLTGPMSRHRLGRARDMCPSSFEGSAVLFRGCGAWAVQEWVTQCQGADTGLTAQCRTVVGMASPGGLAEHHRDMIPRRVRGVARIRL
jgi:hypothetical protein